MERPESLDKRFIFTAKNMTLFVFDHLSATVLQDILARVRAGEINGNTFQYPVSDFEDTVHNIRLKQANAWLVGVSKGDTPKTNFRLQELEKWVCKELAEREVIRGVEEFLDGLENHGLIVFYRIAHKTPRRFEALAAEALKQRCIPLSEAQAA